MRKITYYDILAVPRDASWEEIRKAYRIRAIQVHPDRNKAPNAHQQFIQLRQAYEVLSNPGRRSRYDDKLRNLEGDPAAEINRHAFDEVANPPAPENTQAFGGPINSVFESESVHYDPIGEAINIYTMSWRDFSSYPRSVKVRKVLLSVLFRSFYGFVGAFLALLLLTVWFWFFGGIFDISLMVALYKYPIALLAAFFLIFGKPIVFHYAYKWFGWDNDL